MTKVELNDKSRKARRKEERLAKKKRKAGSDEQLSNEQQRSICQPIGGKRPVKKSKVFEQSTQASVKDVNALRTKKMSKDPYAHLDPALAAAIRKDDEEIAELEAKLGTKKEKSRLHKEYAKLECYGDDFGDFLDDLDEVVRRVVSGDKSGNGKESYKALLSDTESSEDDGSSDSEVEEEVLPMKEPAIDEFEYDDFDYGEENSKNEANSTRQQSDEVMSDSSDGIESNSVTSEDESTQFTDDNDEVINGENVYRPSEGEDVYGNRVAGADANVVKPSNYIPPHLRKGEESTNSVDDEAKRESLLTIQRSLNSALNRLSEDSLVPVTQSIAQLYSCHPKSDVNICVWKNTKNACVARSQVMSSLVPVYVCALAGVHVLKNDSAQLGEFLIEKVVLDLLTELKKSREESKSEEEADNDELRASKEATNLMLVLCYMYNFGIIHCTLLYDLVRNMVESFQEVDVELLLVILSHCGRALRSDDPSALKEIVLMVQKTALEGRRKNSSRVDFMVSAMLDLKNSKRRKADESFAEKTAKLRKSLGQIKSSAGAFSSRSSEAPKIGLDDILNAETKGRWWKVGASWVGNQCRLKEGSEVLSDSTKIRGEVKASSDHAEDETLLKLAAKLRMNTDLRRSVFCVIMGSTDFEDCFEKLVRGGMLKNKSERDTVRVLMECCGNEKAYNKFYSHLASRICDFQPQCKFTFQLAFWDSFKQFDEMSPRKTANLAKLLFNLVSVHNCLKLNVLKAIDMAAPEELDENAMIFLTVFFSSIMENCNETNDVHRLFSIASRRESSDKDIFQESTGGDMEHMDDGEALGANIAVFLVQVMKSSPKYKKGSKFRENLKAAMKSCDPDGFI